MDEQTNELMRRLSGVLGPEEPGHEYVRLTREALAFACENDLADGDWTVDP